MKLYAITAGNPESVVRAVLEVVDFVVVREPALPGWAGRLGERLILHARMPGAVALARARGCMVHLADDGSPAPEGVRWGRSAHSVEAARRCLEEGARYVFLSPIWAPSSKPPRGVPLGPGVLQEVGAVALGGVTPARVAACRGAVGVAVLGGIFGAEEPVSAARLYRAAVSG